MTKLLTMENFKTFLLLLMLWGLIEQAVMLEQVIGYNNMIWNALNVCIGALNEVRAI